MLRRPGDAGVEFEAVPDLCEMSARGDPRLRELAAAAPLQDRRLLSARGEVAVRGRGRAAARPAACEVWNMRVEHAPTS